MGSALPGVQDGVAVVRQPIQDRGLAGAAGPSPQEDSTDTPASSTTERMDRSTGTVRVSSLRRR